MSLEWKANVFLFTMWTISSLYKSVYSNSTTFNRYIYIQYIQYTKQSNSIVQYYTYMQKNIYLLGSPSNQSLYMGHSFKGMDDTTEQIYIFFLSLSFFSSLVEQYITHHSDPEPDTFGLAHGIQFSFASLILQVFLLLLFFCNFNFLFSSIGEFSMKTRYIDREFHFYFYFFEIYLFMFLSHQSFIVKSSASKMMEKGRIAVSK